MCLNQYAQTRKWNWEGDRIVNDPVVPSHRPIPGQLRKRRRKLAERYESYLIDPREFLVTEDNAVLRHCLREKIAPSGGDEERFSDRAPGAFDFRADVITRWVGDQVALHADGDDIWLFPDETLHVRRGDCEDRAVLLAALLIASGISSYNVRVAVGDMWFHQPGRKPVKRDHAWVVYRREDGAWQILEPVPSRPRKAPRRLRPVRANREANDLLGARISYEPTFVWNDDHLWMMDVPPARGRSRSGNDAAKKALRRELDLRRKWTRLKPEFSGDVHRSLLQDALGGYGAPVIDELRRGFHYLFGAYIDWPDMPNRYDPRDHFDNCMIEESWQLVDRRLQRFADKGLAESERLREFALAAHTISDFYAHTSYPWFATHVQHGGRTGYRLFEPAWASEGVPASAARAIQYDDVRFGLRNPKFTTGPRWRGKLDEAIARFAGKILSGRYAHERDSQSFFERFTWMPDEIWKLKALDLAAAAPHHEEMAVDQRNGENILYGKDDFPSEFAHRYVTAVHHVRREFRKVWGPAPQPHPYDIG